MNMSFLKDDPLNTVIVDSSDGKQLYDIQTPSKFSSRTTTIRRSKPGMTSTSGEGEIIAEVQWRKLGSSTITLDGSTVRVKDWLKKAGLFSSSRILTASDGNQYKWTLGSGKFTLRDINTNVQAAQSHRSKTGWFGGTPRKMNIDISPQGMYFLDNIVVSFVIMEEKDRQAKATAATVIVIGNGNTLGATS